MEWGFFGAFIISGVIGLGINWWFRYREEKRIQIPYINDAMRIGAIILLGLDIWMFYIAQPIYQNPDYFNEGVGITSLVITVAAIAFDLFMRASD